MCICCKEQSSSVWIVNTTRKIGICFPPYTAGFPPPPPHTQRPPPPIPPHPGRFPPPPPVTLGPATPCLMVTVGCSYRVNVPGPDANHSPPSSAEFKHGVELHVHFPMCLQGNFKFGDTLRSAGSCRILLPVYSQLHICTHTRAHARTHACTHAGISFKSEYQHDGTFPLPLLLSKKRTLKYTFRES